MHPLIGQRSSTLRPLRGHHGVSIKDRPRLTIGHTAGLMGSLAVTLSGTIWLQLLNRQTITDIITSQMRNGKQSNMRFFLCHLYLLHLSDQADSMDSDAEKALTIYTVYQKNEHVTSE